MRSKLSWLGILLVLLVVNGLILSKESTLAKAPKLILELIPADPRSLMQGDYMNLRYAIAELFGEQNPGESGLAYVSVDARGVGVSVSKEQTPGSLPILFHRVDGRLVIGAESYFFQEGQGTRFADARYGELRVGGDGTPMLIHLLDDKLQVIEP